MYRWLVGNLRLWSVQELVSSELFDNHKSIHGEAVTTNRESVAIHLSIYLLVYVLAAGTMDYKNAGVDIEAGYKSVELMKKHIAKTMRPEVLGGIGGFSGAFSMSAFKNMEEPTLVSGTDGCGTKVKLAMIMDKHDTIGIDAVAM